MSLLQLYRMRSVGSFGQAFVVVAAAVAQDARVRGEAYLFYSSDASASLGRSLTYYPTFAFENVAVDERFIARHAVVWAETEVFRRIANASKSDPSWSMPAFEDCAPAVLFDLRLHGACAEVFAWIRNSTRFRDVGELLDRVAGIHPLEMREIPAPPLAH
ncbi:MAG: hypothetical protein HY059_07470 [Proteobacteria bacterium]|nr:hypothetical protein [Pseudomonadota bacterium]